MTTFTNAVINQETVTTNGMKAFKSTTNPVVDLFFSAGASRGKNIIPSFTASFVQNKELTLRIALWLRDVRGGAGERQLFRDILTHLESTDIDSAISLMKKVPELGRWDDLFVVTTPRLKNLAFTMIAEALKNGNGLAAKWCPRNGGVANELRSFLKMSPRTYRKYIVGLTQVVETPMCANKWDEIDFKHVPSLASSRYKKAFNRHTPKFAEYVNSLINGENGVKVNANAVYPYDVIKGVSPYGMSSKFNQTENQHIIAQWDALPNYVGNNNIMPLVDVSGSMECKAGKSNITCMDVAVSLGLYLADKNQGTFNGTFLTFSESPELIHLKGNIIEKCNQMISSRWGMNTNLQSAFNKILSVAISNETPASEMPEILLILSDMQFDRCVVYPDNAIEMIRRKYATAGYQMPQIVFWNLNSHGNVPVKNNEQGVALVSGFSPAILTSILAANMSNFNPESIMLQTIMNPRYNI